VARGAAELVKMTTNGTTDRGTFQIWESVALAPGGTGTIRLGVPYCSSPTTWFPLASGNTSVVFIDGANLNTGTTSVEARADIETKFNLFQDPTHPAAASFTEGYVCYTPMGRSYVLNAAPGSTTPFDGALPTVSAISIDVTRAAGGTIRSVLLPPNGMSRLFSHT
jgi:hypothetical protein